VSELQLLYLVLVVIYAWECLCWLRRGSVAFVTWGGRRWRAIHPATSLGNQHGGLTLAWPLPPLGTLFVGNQFPLSISADAVLAFVSSSVNPGGRPPQTGSLIRFDEIKSVSANGKKVLINGQLLVRTSSATYAADIAGKLQKLEKLSLNERARMIERMARDRFDTASMKDRWNALRKQMTRVRVLANFLFIYLFAIVPAVLWLFGLRTTWPLLVAVLLVLTTATAVSFWRIHKKFYPESEDERFTHFLIILLSPATTIRACDILTRPLLESFHPLAIAKVVCEDAPFRTLAGMVLREIHYPAQSHHAGANAKAAFVEKAARLLLQQTTEDFLKSNGIKPNDLLKPPPRSEASCQSYCPRCLAQFTVASGLCNDCGGLTLVEFSNDHRVRC
jgi:hypothetical protein